MNALRAALWAEALKLRRSKVPLFTALGFSMVPLGGALFMIILKDPEAAREMGLISAKARLMVGVADWPAYFGFLAQAVAVGGMFLFAIVTAWVFGREFSDRTVKELLALPTPRAAIVAAKFIVIAVWSMILTVFVFGLGVLVGYLVVLPAGSAALLRSALSVELACAALTLGLMPFVALFASMGRGFLPPIGWTIFTVVLTQISVITGWGDWFPWAVPALFSGAAGPRADLLGAHSYVILSLAALTGLAAVFAWWRSADQTR